MNEWNTDRWEAVTRELVLARDVRAIGHHLEQLAAVLVPDLVGVQVTVVFASRLADGIAPPSCRGWTSPVLPALLGTSGVAMGIVDAPRNEWLNVALKTALPQHHQAAAHDVLLDTLATFVHELAHIVEEVTHPHSVLRFPPSPEVMSQALTIAAERASDPRDMKQEQCQHGEAFTRYALHLHHRLSLTGLSLPLSSMTLAGEPYGLSPSTAYSHAIGDEPQRYEGLTFQAISQLSMPHRFEHRFTYDKGARA